MDWKLPDFLQQTFGTNRPEEQVSTSSSEPAAEANEEADLAVRNVQHKGTVPYRRVESAVHTFVHVAVPADLDRLYRHRSNIKKWKKKNEYEKLRAEYINSARTVKQLTLNLKEMETLRAKVLEEDLEKFDDELKSAKESALTAVFEFLDIHGEGLTHGVAVAESSLQTNTSQSENESTSNEPATQTRDTQHGSDTQFENLAEETGIEAANIPEAGGDSMKEGNSEPNLDRSGDLSESAPVVQLRGNQLVIEPTSTQDATNSNHPLSELGAYGPSQLEDEDQTMEQIQSKVEKSKSEQESDEVWEKLRKDLMDLHSVISDFSILVHAQGETVDDIESNIEQAEENIQEGNKYLKKATVLKAAMFPVLGAVVGGVIGGPIGLVAGMKLGSVTSGLTAAYVTGTLIGYQGGKILKKQNEPENMEMRELQEKENEEKEVGEEADNE